MKDAAGEGDELGCEMGQWQLLMHIRARKINTVGLFIAVLFKYLLEALSLRNTAHSYHSLRRATNCPSAAKLRHIAVGLRPARTACDMPIANASGVPVGNHRPRMPFGTSVVTRWQGSTVWPSTRIADL
jgi:hypothetical protein